MRPAASCFLLVVLALAGPRRPARPENPKPSLKLENVTAVEAVAALSKAAGIPVEILPLPAGGPEALPAELHKNVSFDWSSATFAAALRQLCERYSLQL